MMGSSVGFEWSRLFWFNIFAALGYAGFVSFAINIRCTTGDREMH